MNLKENQCYLRKQMKRAFNNNVNINTKRLQWTIGKMKKKTAMTGDFFLSYKHQSIQNYSKFSYELGISS